MAFGADNFLPVPGGPQIADLGPPKIKGILYSPERQVVQMGAGTGIAGFHTFTFQYNPPTMQFMRELEYQEIDPPGSMMPATYFVKAKPDEIDFQLRFQAMEPTTLNRDPASLATYGIKRELAGLLAFTYSTDFLQGNRQAVTSQRPPQTIFSLGRHFSMPVWIRKLSVNYLRWTPDMLPIEATVDVSLITRGMTDEMMSWLASVDTLFRAHMESTGNAASGGQQGVDGSVVNKNIR